jgi:hypothetical protein
MARATSPTASDASDNQPSKEKATNDPESEGEGEDEEVDEEYEIEAIIDAKRGVFGEVCSIRPELHNASDSLRVGAHRISREMEGLRFEGQQLG